MLYGYARVSTIGQCRDGNSLDAQVLALQQAGAVRILKEAVSGKAKHRSELDKLLKVLQSGDTLITTRLDRIARSLLQGIQLLENISKMGVTINVLNLGIIDDSPIGKLIRNIMLSFSEFEHDIIAQRTQAGKAIARQRLYYRDGRPKKFSRLQLDHALELLEDHSYKQVERMTGISVTTIYRAKIERARRA